MTKPTIAAVRAVADGIIRAVCVGLCMPFAVTTGCTRQPWLIFSFGQAIKVLSFSVVVQLSGFRWLGLPKMKVFVLSGSFAVGVYLDEYVDGTYRVHARRMTRFYGIHGGSRG